MRFFLFIAILSHNGFKFLHLTHPKLVLLTFWVDKKILLAQSLLFIVNFYQCCYVL
jgi:hypothetical protein